MNSSIHKADAFNTMTKLTSTDFITALSALTNLPSVRRDLLVTKPADPVSSSFMMRLCKVRDGLILIHKVRIRFSVIWYNLYQAGRLLLVMLLILRRFSSMNYYEHMQHKINRVIGLIIVCNTIFLPFVAMASIVPACTTTPCGYTDLINLANSLLQFLVLYISVPLATISFVYAGFLYITSSS